GDVCKGFSFAKTGATAGTCAPIGEIGASCDGAAQISGCAEGLDCVSGKCADKPVSGPCSGAGDCKEGVAYCDGSSCQLAKRAGPPGAGGGECGSRTCDPSPAKCVAADALSHEP